MKTFGCIFLLCALIISFNGCGKKGDPRLPDGVKDNYPRAYPK